jgi:hypothetical protein
LKSDLIYLLVLVDKQQMSEAPGAKWENYYADFFVNRYLKSIIPICVEGRNIAARVTRCNVSALNTNWYY